MASADDDAVLSALRATAVSDSLIDIGANLTKCKRPDTAAQLQRASAAGVGTVLVTGCDRAGSSAAATLCKWWWASAGATGPPQPRLYHTAGVHPHDAQKAARPDGSVDPKYFEALEALARTPLCVAVGECGLDYDRMFSPRNVQHAVFEAQCALAAKLNMPLFVHCRDRDASRGEPLGAYDDLLAVLGRHVAGGLPPSRVLVHCFTGGPDELRRLVSAGVAIGLTGFVGMKKRASLTLEALRTEGPALLKDLRLHIETDAPFMTPDAEHIAPDVLSALHAQRGRTRNEPCVLPAVCNALAAAIGETPESVGRATSRASRDFFGLDAAEAAASRDCAAWAAELKQPSAAADTPGLAPPSAPSAPPSASTCVPEAMEVEAASAGPEADADGADKTKPRSRRRRGKGGRRGGAGGSTDDATTSDAAQAAGGASGPRAAGPPPPLPASVLTRPRTLVLAFGEDSGPEGTWVAANWMNKVAPRSYSGFFLPLIYEGLAAVDDGGALFDKYVNGAPQAHFDDQLGSRPRATLETVRALSPFWCGAFSHWSVWVGATRDAAAAGRLTEFLDAGTSARAAWLAPKGGCGEPMAFGAVPHLKPAAQTKAMEEALGPLELARLEASIGTLFACAAASPLHRPAHARFNNGR